MTNSNLWYAAGLTAIATLGYLIYFDNQRRTNPEFRRKIRESKRIAKKLAADKPKTSSVGLEDEPIPTTAEGLQEYFLKYIQAGDALSKQGPAAYEMAAACFVRAIQVYPEPMQLLTSLQQSIDPAIMDLIMAQIAAQVKAQSKDEGIE